MAAVTVTNAQVSPVFPDDSATIIRSRIAAATILAGQAVYYNSSGQADLCGTNTAGAQQFRGIALEQAGAGQAVDILEQGEVEGFNLSGAGLTYDALVFAQDTAGALGTAAGTKSVVAGRVVPMSNRDSSGNIKMVLFIGVQRLANW